MNAFTPTPGNHLNDYENQYSTLEPMQHMGADINLNDASFNNESPQHENKQSQNLFPTIQPSASGMNTFNDIDGEESNTLGTIKVDNRFNASTHQQ